MTLVGARGAELELNGNHAIYSDALEHTDSVVLQGDGWVEQLLVFRDDQAPRRVAFYVTSGGPIREVVEENGALRFVDGAGATSLSMARPFAVDADGQRLELDVQWSEGRLELALRDVSARYPVVLDPAIEVVGWTRMPIFEHRSGAAMATLNGTIVLFGGVDQQSQDLDDTWTFDGAVWTHRQLSVSPPGRSGHAMAAVNGKVILFGGSRNRVDLGDTWEWDGARWTEKRVAISPPPRSQHAMAAAGTDLVLFGGSVPTSDTWLWNGSTWTEQHPISSPAARFGHVMASTGSSVVLGGGRTGFSVTNQDTWIWNSGTWTRDIRPSQVFFSESMLVDGPGSVTLISRGGSGPAPWVSSIFRWEPANGWSLVNGSSAAYFSQSGSAAQLGANTVVVSGTANPTWIWDGGTWAPSPATAAAPYPQRWTSMAALDGSVIVFGDGVSESWLWNGERWALGPVSPAPPGRTLHAMTEFGARVVLYGGSATGIGQLDDTWELDELGWHQRSPTASPPARIGHSMSATAGHVVVFGGEVGSVLSDETWLWDGGAWARVSPAISPPPRLSSAMAPVDGGVLLFGGEGALGFLLNDTWFWNGASWSELERADAGHAAATSGRTPNGEPGGQGRSLRRCSGAARSAS